MNDNFSCKHSDGLVIEIGPNKWTEATEELHKRGVTWDRIEDREPGFLFLYNGNRRVAWYNTGGGYLKIYK